MKDLIDALFYVNPVIWLMLGIILIGIAMVAFAWVTWPDGFEGLIKTLWGLLTTLVAHS